MKSQHKQSLTTVSILFCITAHTFIMNGFYSVHPYNNVGTYYASVFARLDPSLFRNSIFVQAVERTNLRLSVFFDVFPFFLRHVDFETFTFFQGFVSTFFIIAGIFMLARTLLGSVTTGYLATLLYTVQLNQWTLGSPAPYLNFFHHGLPYTYPLIVWSLVFFFKKKYPLSALLAGISWNFHPMSTLFLLITYGVYYCCERSEFTAKTIMACSLLFILSASPVLIKILQQIDAGRGEIASPLWFKGVYWNAWYTCFPATWPRIWFLRAGIFLAVFYLCFLQIQNKELKYRLSVILSAVALMCLAGTIFSDIFPVPIIIKISFWRSSFIFLVLAVPCIAFGLTQMLQRGRAWGTLAVLLTVFLTGYIKCPLVYFFPFFVMMLMLILYENLLTPRMPALGNRFMPVFILMLAAPCTYWYFAPATVTQPYMFLFCLCIFVCLFFHYKNRVLKHINPVAMGFIFLMLLDISILWQNNGLNFYYKGRIRGAYDPWAELQFFARDHSQKDDLFIVPPYLNDFCNYSQRAILSDWAEGANILYLDNQFAAEWFERMNDLGWTEQCNAREGFNRLATADIIKAAYKYGAGFVVTEKPKIFNLDKIYENSKYCLYKIK